MKKLYSGTNEAGVTTEDERIENKQIWLLQMVTQADPISRTGYAFSIESSGHHSRVQLAASPSAPSLSACQVPLPSPAWPHEESDS